METKIRQVLTSNGHRTTAPTLSTYIFLGTITWQVLFTPCTRGQTSSESTFIQEPEDVWIVKSEPVEIFCIARDVIKVVFYCDGSPVSKKSQKTTTDDSTKQTKSFISEFS